jgi:cell wall-associated NlpC family hydrolase
VSTNFTERWPRTACRFLPALLLLALALIVPSTAAAGGGVSADGTEAGGETVPGSKAKLVNGKAIAPEDAPERVKKVIAAANKIRNKPYRYGGGHADFKDSGYDCSGAASYALHGGGFLKTPIDSNGMARFGEKGKGEWISVYGAPSHGYIVVAGLRFDTAMTPGDGPSWSKNLRSTPENYKVRHPKGY